MTIDIEARLLTAGTEKHRFRTDEPEGLEEWIDGCIIKSGVLDRWKSPWMDGWPIGWLDV